MRFSNHAESTRPGGAPRLCRLISVLGGGILFQAAVGGCEESLASIADAMGQPLATGIGNALSKLAEAMVLNLVT